MKITIPISLGVLHALAQSAEAAEGFLSLPLSRRTPSQTLARRQTDVSLSVSREGDAYFREVYMIDVDIGTPKQRVQLAVEIGQRMTHVMGNCETPSINPNVCDEMGAYNASLSATATYIAEDGFEETYTGDDIDELSYARFQYYADDLTIEGQDTLDNVTFIAYKSSEYYQYGILGLGVGESDPDRPPVPGILRDLKSQGLIAARAFAMTFGGDGDSGSLVLGGVDTKKFSGALTKVPVIDAPKDAESWETDKYWVSVDGATADSGNGTRTAFDGFKVMVQSTSTLSHLPDVIVIAVAEAFGVRNFSGDWDIIPCSRGDDIDGSLELELSGFTASIPYGNLLLPYEGPDAKEGDCYITVQPGDYDLPENALLLLGSTFLRSVYAVFDQDDKAVWMAKYDDCGSEPVAFSKGSDVRGQCDGKASGQSPSDEEKSSGDEDDDSDGNAGRRMGVNMTWMFAAALATLIFWT